MHARPKHVASARCIFRFGHWFPQHRISRSPAMLALHRTQLDACLRAITLSHAGAAGARAHTPASPAAPGCCLTSSQQPATTVHWLCRPAIHEPADSPTAAPAAFDPRVWGALGVPIQTGPQEPLAATAGSSMDVDQPPAKKMLSGNGCPAEQAGPAAAQRSLHWRLRRV